MTQTTKSPIFVVLIALLLSSLACSLITEDTITDKQRLVREDRPALILLSPNNGTVYAKGATVPFHLLAHDLGAGVSRVEVQIDVIGEEILLQDVANPPVATFETVISWQATTIVNAEETFIVTVRAFRANGDPNDPSDDIPSNEEVLTIKVVPAPDIEFINQPLDEGENGSPIDTETDTAGLVDDQLATFPASVISVWPAPVRQGPETSYPLIRDLETGTEIEVVGRSADGVWLVLRLDNGYGWIFRDMVNIAADSSSLPVVQAPSQ